jgi:cobalt-zinc-cadmium efflux system outer membrane protein
MKTFHKAVALVAISFCILEAQAQSYTPTQAEKSLKLEDAIRYTLQHNPQLVGYELRVKALQGERQSAELKPQMRASAHLENIAGSGDFKGVDSAELTLSLSSIIELNEQRDARIGLVTARQQQLESTQRLLTLDVLTQLTQQFIALAATQEKLTLLQQSHALAQENFKSLDQQKETGRTSDIELLRAKAALAKANLSVKKTQRELTGERLKLSAFWAENSPAFTEVNANLFSLPALAPLDFLIKKLDANSDLAVLGDEVYLRAAELRQARAERKANLEWSAGVRNLQASDDSALVVGLTVPLGSASRASGVITTANANHAQAEQALAATRIKLHAQLNSLYSAYENAAFEVESLQTDVLPAVQQALVATSNAFNRGRYSYLELNLAQRELLDTRIAIIESAAHAHLIHTEIERLTGSTAISETISHSESRILP